MSFHFLKVFRPLLVALCLIWLAAMPAQAQVANLPITNPGLSQNRYWLDVNGDGRDDYCTITGEVADRLECYMSTGSGFDPNKLYVVIPSRGFPFWIDFNGDGKVDLCLGTGQVGGTVDVTSWVDQAYATVICRLGPTFTAQVNFSVPAQVTERQVVSGNTFTRESYGLGSWSEAFPTDVNGDGRVDFCYLYAGSSGRTLRCLLSNGAGVDAQASSWISVALASGQADWPRGFYDFNADGFQDFCRVISGGTVRCLLGGANGFTSTDVASVPVTAPNREGAAFVDVNGDGNIDFCRNAGTGGANFLSCLMSNGIGWEAAERQSNLLDLGDQNNRWWVDINADGLPDYCRYVSGAKMACRLSRGDGDGSTAQAFGFTDVVTAPLDFGNEAGKAFCDVNGNGLQTFCRVTFPQTGTQQLCYYNDEGVETCYDVPVNSWNLSAGLVAPASSSDATVQARAPFLTAFSDGVGAEVRISYLPLTNPLVYLRQVDDTSPRHAVVQPRASVVYETRSWRQGSSEPMTGIARYAFKDYRNDIYLGARGFRERWIFTEASNTLEHVVFYQGLGPSVDSDSIENDRREVGLVKLQERYAVYSAALPPLSSLPGAASPRAAYVRYIMDKARGPIALPTGPLLPASPFVLLQRTTNTLRDTSPANPRYRFTGSSVGQGWDWNAQTNAPVALPKVESTTEMDSLGNVTRLYQKTTDEATGLWWSKQTTNEYDPAKQNIGSWIVGRLTKATVESQAPTVERQLAANPRSAGRSPNAASTSSSTPAAPQPINPAVLTTILQLLLED